MNRVRILEILQSPLAVLVAIGGGIWVGYYYPEIARTVSPVGQAYQSLLKMVVLPFIVSSIIFSIRALIRDPHSSRYLYRIVFAVLTVSFLSVALAGSLALILRPGEIRDPQSRMEFGKMISRDNGSGISTDIQMTLATPPNLAEAKSPLANILEVVPSNIFYALSNGETIKVLLFSLVFGMAVGFVPISVSKSFAEALDTVYRSCIILTRWLNVLLPFATFAMIAEQTASVGLEPLRLMIDFLMVLAISCAIFMIASMIIVYVRSGEPFWSVVRAHQTVLMMAIATRSSVACIPMMIDLLSERLKFRRVVVELLVPLQTALLRAGPIMIYVIGTLFIAQLYGKVLSGSDLVLIGFSSVLLGLTTAGMSGILIVSQMSILCGYFSIPFEAAFVLFIAVDTISDTLRTLTLVSTITASTAAIAPRANSQATVVPDLMSGEFLNEPAE